METQSKEVDKIAEAMKIIQQQIGAARKTSTNPFYHSSYADLTTVWGACRETAHKNNIVPIYTATVIDGRNYLVITLQHDSGQFYRGWFELVTGTASPQDLGKAYTYMRRYGTVLMFNLMTTDDDAESAMGRKPERPTDKIQREQMKVLVINGLKAGSFQGVLETWEAATGESVNTATYEQLKILHEQLKTAYGGTR